MSKSLGSALALSASDVARWRRRVAATASCSLWLGAVGSDGYGRFAVRGPDGSARTVTPHQVAARLAWGDVPPGATLMHDCDMRLCVATAPGHLRVGTQSENMRQAARRGRAAGPRPGLVDVRGKAGASLAVQAAIRAALAAGVDDRDELAAALAAAVAAGDPLAGLLPMFDLPTRPRPPVACVDDGPGPPDGAAESVAAAAASRPLFDL